MKFIRFEIDPASDFWTVTAPFLSPQPYKIDNPLLDSRLLGEARELRSWARHPIPSEDPSAAGLQDYLRRLSISVGERISSKLLTRVSSQALYDELQRIGAGGACLKLQFVDRGSLTDEALDLPFELLSLQRGAVSSHSHALRVVREILVEGAPEFTGPTGPLSVAVMIAAPDNLAAFPYEQESFRLQVALEPLGHRVAFSDLGNLADLVRLVDRRAASLIHFRGHSLPGTLVFEDNLGFAQEVEVRELQRQLNKVLLDPGCRGHFPQVFFLASYPGDSHGGAATSAGAVAAALHRSGFPQVVNYAGPADAALSSRAETAYYTSLAQGETCLTAADRMRRTLSESIGSSDQRIYPLGWSQLTVYHRGPDASLTLHPARTGWKEESARSSAEEATRQAETQAQDTGSALTYPLHTESIQVDGLPILAYGFIGRRSAQHRILRRIDKGERLLVLQGLGGLGKTALASQLLRRVLAPDPADQLVLRCSGLGGDAAAIEILRSQAEDHGRLHGLENWDQQIRELRQEIQDPAEGFAAVVRQLRRSRPNIVLYADNAESLQLGPKNSPPTTLGEWIPEALNWWQQLQDLASEGVLIIITTRYGWIDLPLRSYFPIDPLSKSDSMKLIQAHKYLSRLSLDTRRRLARHSDGHPLTLVLLDRQLETLLERSPDLAERFISGFFSRGAPLLTEHLLLGHILKGFRRSAKQHLRFLMLLNHPAPLFVIDQLGPCRRELIASGLLTQYCEQQFITEKLVWVDRWGIHPVVRDFLEENVRLPKSRAHHRTVGLAYLAWQKRFPWSRKDEFECLRHLHLASEGQRAWEICEAHVIWLRDASRLEAARQLLERSAASGLKKESLAMNFFHQAQVLDLQEKDSENSSLLLKRALSNAESVRTQGVAYHLLGEKAMHLGSFQESEEHFLRALGLKERAFGRHAAETQATLISLADLYMTQARYDEAEPLLIAAFSTLKEQVGTENVVFGDAAKQVVRFLIAKGEYDSALALAEGVVVLFDRLLPSGHPRRIIASAELCEILERQGKYQEAESMWRRIEESLVRSLGPAHSASVGARYNLAHVLLRNGQLSEAEEICRTMLKDRSTEAHGAGTFFHNLATLLTDLGYYSEAEDLLQISQESYAEEFDASHPEHGRMLASKAKLMVVRGDYAEANSAFEKALVDLEKRFDPGHPEIGRNSHQRAITLSHLGKLDEAEALVRQSLVIEEASLGRDHPGYVRSLQVLAMLFLKSGRYRESEKLLREALSIVDRTLGYNHFTRAEILHGLGSVLDLQGDLSSAEDLLRKSLAIKQEVFGGENGETLHTAHQLALVLHKAEKTDEAESLSRHVIFHYQRNMGADSSRLCPTLCVLALILLERGEAIESEQLAGRAVTLARRAFEAPHDEIGSCLAMLAQAQAVLDRSTAAAVAKEALANLTESLGPDHPLVEERTPLMEDIAASRTEYLDGYRFLYEVKSAESAAEANDYPATLAVMKRLIARSRRMGESEAALGYLRSFLYDLAVIYVQTGQFEEAIEALEEAAGLAERIGSSAGTDYLAAIEEVRAMAEDKTSQPDAIR